MKPFKKFFAALLALTMTLSLAACGGASDDTAAEGDGSGEGEATMYKIGISQYGEHGSHGRPCRHHAGRQRPHPGNGT